MSQTKTKELTWTVTTNATEKHLETKLLCQIKEKKRKRTEIGQQKFLCIVGQTQPRWCLFLGESLCPVYEVLLVSC